MNAASMVALPAILSGGLSAAMLDIAYAITRSVLQGATAERLLQSVASGLQGPEAFRGGWPSALLGLAAHCAILLVAATLYWLASARLVWSWRLPWLAGPLFGLTVWAVMNWLVVPWSAAPFTLTYTPASLLLGLLVHMALVGLPIALATRWGRQRLHLSTMTRA